MNKVQEQLLNLRITRSHGEIIETISQIYAENMELMVWQNQNGKRVVAYTRIGRIDFGKKTLRLIRSEGVKKFSMKYPLYIRSEHKHILFKQSDCKIMNQEIDLSLPKEVRMQEQRTIPRLLTTHAHDISAYFTKKIGAGVGSTKSFTAKIINLSANGACFEFLQNMGKFFYENDDIVITHLNHSVFSSELVAQIIYIQKPKLGSERLRMGIKFKTALSKPMLLNIVKNHLNGDQIKSS